jgi:oxygen-independent coproporphyrinogen III oxidase
MTELYNKVITHEWFTNRYAEYYRWYPKSLNVVSPLLHFGNCEIKGLYIHVPFCDELCKFCPFNKKKSENYLLDKYVEGLCQEIKLYAEQGVFGELKFIYFGGGTPSVLTNSQFSKIFNSISSHFLLAPQCEISIEAHPTHINKDAILSWQSVGINRISSGIQSFSASNLEKLGATHTVEDAVRTVDALSEWIDKSAIDLLYRCEGQTISDWEAELDFVSKFSNITHVSCYTLFLLNSDNQPNVLEDARMAVIADEFLNSKGFIHYASCATGGFDFAKPGYECIYETLHWKAPQTSYLALGPGALGYMDNKLIVNIHTIQTYINKLKNMTLPILSLTPVNNFEQKHRFFTLGVKTLSVNLQDYVSDFHDIPTQDFNNELSNLISLELIEIDDNILRLTDLGRFYVDQVSEIFWSEDQKDVPHPETTAIMNFERKYTKTKSIE